MILTEFFRLRKPEGTDPVNVEDFNDNFDVIDTELNNRPTKTGAATNMVTVFSQASARANLTSGETIATSFGKLMKWFADLKTVAFSGSYSDLSSKPTLGTSASHTVVEDYDDAAAITEAGYVTGGKVAAAIIKNLGDCTFSVQSDGAYVTYTPTGGADPVTKKLGSPEILTKTVTSKTGSFDTGGTVLFAGIASVSYKVSLYGKLYGHEAIVNASCSFSGETISWSIGYSSDTWSGETLNSLTIIYAIE